MPFVVIDNKTNKIIGATRFCNTNINDKRVEIGFTWYSKSYQKSAINTNCKYLLLSHAIARLGAKQDGILRNHSKDKDGGYRDTVVFSIINHEWLIVKKSLEYKLNKKY